MSLCKEWYEVLYERLERRIEELEGDIDEDKLDSLRKLRKLKVILQGHRKIGEEIVLDRLRKNDYSEAELTSYLKSLEECEDLTIKNSAIMAKDPNEVARNNFIAKMIANVSGESAELQNNALLDYFEKNIPMIGFDRYFDSLLILSERAGEESAIREALEKINFGNKVIELYTTMETDSCYERRKAKESDDMREVVGIIDYSEKNKELNMNKAIRLLLVAKKLGLDSERDYFLEVISRPEVEQLFRKRRESREWCEKMEKVLKGLREKENERL